jgi:starch-binding outer membrane protein, SusD/RagB family
MKKLNNIYKIAFLAVTISFGACSEDFLYLPPQTNLTVSEFYKNQSDFETAVNGLYNRFQNYIYGNSMYEEFRSDNMVGWQIRWNNMCNNTFDPSSNIEFWQVYTTLIYPANVILAKLDEVDMDDAAKNRIKGEAHFFRGFAYHQLVLWFGGVPLVTKQLSLDESYELGRSTEADTWAQVQSDYSVAYQLLDPSVEIGRVDKYDAGAFLGKAYMQQQKWAEAESVLAAVFNNSGAMLEPNFNDNWTFEAETASREYMLSVRHGPQNPANTWRQWYIYMPWNPQEYKQGYKPGFYESFEAGDIRRDETLGFAEKTLAEMNLKHDYGTDPETQEYWGDIIVLRFADVQLLYAEAISMNAGSPQQQSLDLMNETRNRGGLGPLFLADVPTLDDFVTAILAERRAELALEGHRYSDLKRHDKLVEYVTALGPPYDQFDETYNYIPIPQIEIDKVGSDVLPQNPGY